MRVLISGLPLFSKRLAEDLQEFDTTSSYHFLDTYNSKLAQLKFLFLLPFADCVISMNGVTDNSGSLNWVLRLKKKLIMQWMGTDVMIALERYKEGTIDRKYIDYAKHLVDATWLKDELKESGISAQLIDFKYTFPGEPLYKYEKNSVMSYVAQARQEFYGIEMILQAAEKFPDIDFLLYGMNETKFVCPKNVKLMGWTTEAEFAEGLKSTSVFLRLPKHDGFSASVIEAMGFGCEVFWTFPGTKAVCVKNSEELIDKLATKFEDIESRNFHPNQSSREFVLEKYNKEKVIKNYIQTLKEFVG
jgi:glycosyltransferase involved in cell wall biosynthesis